MRNLKRALSLALASVMLLGMMVVGTGAFEDVTDSHNEEAIAVMELAGIMIGDDKGNFNPDKKVTRNEMAVIMANMLGLDVEDYAGIAPFTDVPAWAEAYVSACYAKEIVSGTSATTYTGDAEVKAVDAGLMVMKALGYFQYASDFGTDYKVAAITKASEIDLFDDIKAKTNDALTRNEVAQLCLNALNKQIVSRVSSSLAVNDNGQLHNVYTYTAAGDYLYIDLYEGELTKDETVTDDFGRPAVEWEKDDKTVKAAKDADFVVTLDKNTYADEAALTEAVLELLDKDEDELTVVAGGAVVYINGTNADDLGAEAAYAYATAGTVMELFVNDDDQVTNIVAYNYDTVEITDVYEIDEEEELAKDYGASVIYTINGESCYVDALTESHDDYQAIGEYEKEDTLTVVMKGTKILFDELAKTVDGVKTASGDGYVKLDGTKYVAEYGVAAPNFDDTYTYVQAPNGALIASELKEEAEGAMEYVYVMAKDAKDEGEELLNGDKNEAVVKVMYLDGTVKTLAYELKKATKAISGTDIAKDDIYFVLDGEEIKFTASDFETEVEAGWYSYTMNGDAITLKTAVKDDASIIDTISAEKDVKVLVGDLFATSKTVVTILNKDGVAETYTGFAKFPEEAFSNEALVLYKDAQVTAAYAYIEEYEADDTTTVDVAMFVETGDTVADGTVVTFYEAGKKVTYTVETVPADAAAGMLYSIEIEDGVATLGDVDEYVEDEAGYVAGTVTVVSDEYVVIDGTDYDLADDCAVYQASMDNKTLSKGTLATEKTVTAILNSDNKVVEIYIYKTPVL